MFGLPLCSSLAYTEYVKGFIKITDFNVYTIETCTTQIVLQKHLTQESYV